MNLTERNEKIELLKQQAQEPINDLQSRVTQLENEIETLKQEIRKLNNRTTIRF
jgi:peptidoglycan hydrolase CwlO-like protein